MGQDGGVNIYACVLNNPVGETDPLGLDGPSFSDLMSMDPQSPAEALDQGFTTGFGDECGESRVASCIQECARTAARGESATQVGAAALERPASRLKRGAKIAVSFVKAAGHFSPAWTAFSFASCRDHCMEKFGG